MALQADQNLNGLPLDPPQVAGSPGASIRQAYCVNWPPCGGTFPFGQNMAPMQYCMPMLQHLLFVRHPRSPVSWVALAITMMASPANARPARHTQSRELQENREALEKAAKKACITGDYRKGVDLLADLYVESNDPTCVYNQGRCFEQNHLWQDALDRFREYGRKVPNMSTREAEELTKHVTECESHLEAQKPVAPRTEPDPLKAAPVAPVIDKAGPEPAAVLAAPAVPERRRGSVLPTAGLLVDSLGLASVATGIALNLKSNSITNQMYPPGHYDSDRDSTRRSYKMWAWVSFGVGTAAILAGTTMCVLGWKAQDNGSQISFGPLPIPGGIAATLQGTY